MRDKTNQIERFGTSDGEERTLTAMVEDPRILVVDDDEGTRRTLVLILERHGYAVDAAATAQEALREANQRSYNVGLLDIKLPDGKGVELLEPLKKLHPSMELIMVTGYASTETAMRALNEGATAYLTKPLNMDEVLAKVRQILEKQRLVAEARAAERRLRRSEERYRSLFEGIPVGLYRTTADGRIIHANQALVDMLGYPDRQTLMRVDIGDLYVDPRDRQRERDLLDEDGGVRGFEMQLRRHDDSVIWARDTVRVDRDASGRPVTHQGSLEDITERKRAQEALERQLGRASLLNEIARVIAARQDLDSSLRVVVQRLEESFTDLASVWLREGDSDLFTLAATGDRNREIVSQSDRPQQMTVPSEPARHLMRGEIWYVADMRQLDAAVIKRLVARTGVRSAVVTPLEAEDSLLGVIVSARQKPDAFSQEERGFLRSLALHVGLAVRQARLHENLEEAYQDLRRTQQAMMRHQRLRALGEMASGIAHDINNAISPIPLYTAVIEQEADLDDKARAHLRIIETAISDVEETVARMREFYRERKEEELRPVDVNEAARQAIKLTRPRWRDVPQEQGITIDLQTDLPDDLPLIMGLEGEIRQAVTNLILNAVDAMPDGGTLCLRTREGTGDPPHIVLEVSDTGIGMDEERQERCFEPFFSTKGERGSGMGLATVYGTLQRHGGDVELKSTPGEGTTMRLLFPVHEMVDEGAFEEPAPLLSSLHVLCVDDEPAVREALKRALEGEGHAVELADDGASGLEAFRTAQERGEPFDVVITDLGMPKISGRQVAQTVKREAPETPVILLTGWGRQLSAENDVPEAVDLMLGKPPTVEGLNRALRQVVAAS